MTEGVRVPMSAALNEVVVTQEVWPSAEQSAGDGVSDPATPARVIPVLIFDEVTKEISTAGNEVVATQEVWPSAEHGGLPLSRSPRTPPMDTPVLMFEPIKLDAFVAT
jgi:hypothetical protein